MACISDPWWSVFRIPGGKYSGSLGVCIPDPWGYVFRIPGGMYSDAVLGHFPVLQGGIPDPWWYVFPIPGGMYSRSLVVCIPDPLSPIPGGMYSGYPNSNPPNNSKNLKLIVK